MKIIIIFAFLVCSQLTVYSHYYPQNKLISLDIKDKQIEYVLAEIESQSGYAFVYNTSRVDLTKIISVSIFKSDIKFVLKAVLKNTIIKFSIENLTIFLFNGTIVKKTVLKLSSTVCDESNFPIPGVNVIVKGTLIGTLTDIEGKFMLKIKDPQAIIQFSLMGFSTIESPISSIGSKIILKEESIGIDEVVVVGYGTKKKKSMIGAVSVISSESIEKLTISDVGQALQGISPGVQVYSTTGAPGEGVSIRIRGIGTINNNEPLYIIDGVPTRNGINTISPSDIESISVLKDAASAAIYGSRASNGVVLVTTKKGVNGKTKISYNMYEGIQQVANTIEMANTDQYIEIFNESVDNDNKYYSVDELSVKGRHKIPKALRSQLANTNWQDEIFRTAYIQNHNFSIRGGTENLQFVNSFRYFSQDGIVFGSDYEKYNFSTNINSTINKRIKVSTSVKLNFSTKNIIGSSGDGLGGNGGSVVRYALLRNPAVPVYNKNGEFSDLPKFVGYEQRNLNTYFADGYNPVGLAEKFDNVEENKSILANVNLQYTISKNVFLNTNFSLDYSNINVKRFDEKWGDNDRINGQNALSNSTAESKIITFNSVLNYSRIFKKNHDISTIIGIETIKSKSKYHSGGASCFVDQIKELRYLSNGINPIKTAFGRRTSWALLSFFGRVNYSYNNKYLFSVSLRNDGSSRLKSDNRFDLFSSYSFGWKLSEEKIIKRIKSISFLKLRAGYGQLGNQEIGNFSYVSTYSSGYNYPFGGSSVSNSGYSLNRRGNENVKWEISEHYNIGLDLSMFKNMISINTDLFYKKTKDMLVPVPLPRIGGNSGNPWQNVGEVLNKGVEFELTYNNIESDLKYSIGFNITYINNKVTKLNKPILAGATFGGYVVKIEEGKSIGSFYMYEMEGIFQKDSEIFLHALYGDKAHPGDIKYVDNNADGLINEFDKKHVGSSIPDLTFGITTNFDYEDFDLSIFLQGIYGSEIYYQVASDIEGFYRGFNVTKRMYDNRWTGEGTSNFMPRPSWEAISNNLISTRYLEDGSYLRIQNIQLGYSIQKSVLEFLNIERMRIYTSVQNLYTFTTYPGLDPEMGASDNINVEGGAIDLARNVDWGTYPVPRIFTLGLNVNF